MVSSRASNDCRIAHDERQDRAGSAWEYIQADSNMEPKISRCSKCQSELIVVMDESVPTLGWHGYDTDSLSGSGGNGVLPLNRTSYS